MKKIYKGVLCFISCLLLGGLSHSESFAANDTQVNVTVPANVNVVFNEDGTNSIGEFTVQNHSQVPVRLTNVRVKTKQDWELVREHDAIPTNAKQLVFQMEGNCLKEGDNSLQVQISENTKKKLNVVIKRGAWTTALDAQEAFSLEFSYEVGKKEFQLTLDGNGSGESLSPIKACNGDTVKLPKPFRVKHQFVGWQDAAGNLYEEDYVMPIGGGSLKAVWQKTDAYAIYSADDKSLRFIRSDQPISEGSVYGGRTVTHVYTGFEDYPFDASHTPDWIWAGGNYGGNMVSVIVEDVIQPISMAYWFFAFRDTTYFELDKIDTSRVTNAEGMFCVASSNITDTVIIQGITNWDVSNVTNMEAMFWDVAANAKKLIVDDITGWNVRNVTKHDRFNTEVEAAIPAPKWVH